jgi:hypothetical protein
MKTGRVVGVIPHPQLSDAFTEYEIDFGFRVAIFYETQLRLASPGKSSKSAKAP